MISRFDNCIFVHIPKVAGQSIESVFLSRAGLSWQQRDKMLLRKNRDPQMGPPRLAHLTAEEYVALGYLTIDEFNNLFKFSFVRNPWERLVSEYLYRNYTCSFKDFLIKFFPKNTDDNYPQGRDCYRHVIPQYKFLYDQHENLLVDFIGRYENLTKDFGTVSELIMGQRLQLPHKNKTQMPSILNLLKIFKNNSKSTKPDYRKYYDAESIEIVAELYKEDISLFGYQFEN